MRRATRLAGLVSYYLGPESFLFYLVSVSDPATVPVGPTSIVRSNLINHRMLAPLLYNNVLPRCSRTPILSR